MRRGLWIALKIAIVVALAIWIVERPGTVTIEWLGWRLEEAPVGLLLLAVLVVAALAALLYHFWRLLRGAPGGISRYFAGNRRQRGYRALSQGMAAVAAGDAGEAARWAKRSEALLEDPPLTRLLQAQAAQLNGDENAAERYFEAMLESPDTRFLGLRGLVNQALKAGDDARALEYLRQAHQLRPKTPWVLTSLIELAERNGELTLAEEAVAGATRAKLLAPAEGSRKLALLALERAAKVEAAGRDGSDPEGRWREEARREAQRAHKFAADFLPATLCYARLSLETDRKRDAQRALEAAWKRSPHPELATLYRASLGRQTPVETQRQLQKLLAGNADHAESHIARAEAALEAQLWGEGRRHLKAAGGDHPSARVCRLWAALEESENGPGEAARKGLERALVAPPDARWLCDTCGTQAPTWQPRCAHCQSFDTLTWRPPRQAIEQPAALTAPKSDSKAVITVPATALTEA